MKKRLLSAALALAMVLTLLPFSALPVSATALTDPIFPAVTSGNRWQSVELVGNATAGVVYHESGFKDANGIVYNQNGWYHVDTTNRVVSSTGVGVISGSEDVKEGRSGTWYTSPDTAILAQSAFTLINSQSLTNIPATMTGLTINLNGQTLSWNVAALNNLSSLTLTSNADTVGQFSPSGSAFTAGKDFTFSMTGGEGTSSYAQVNGSITITNTSKGAVNLNNAFVTGGVAINGSGSTAQGASVDIKGAKGHAASINITNQSSGGSVSVTDGSFGSGINVYTGSGGTITLSNASSESGVVQLFDNVFGGTGAGGSITIGMGSSTGHVKLEAKTGGTISLGSNVAGGTATVGDVTLSSDSGGKITAWNTSNSTKAVRLRGVGSSLDITSCTLGPVRVLGSNDPDVTTGTAPTVTVKGQSTIDSLAAFADNDGGPEYLTGAYTVNLSGSSTVTKSISFKYANVTLNASHSTSGVTLGAGKLTLTGGPINVGDITLGSLTNNADAALDVLNGTRVTTGDIKEVTGHRNNIDIKIPVSRTNNFGTIGTAGALTAPFTKHGIAGGNFKTDVASDLRNEKLTYRANVTSTGATSYPFAYYYGTAEDVNQLVKDYQAAKGNMVVTLAAQTADGVGAGGNADARRTLTFKDSTNPDLTSPETVLVITFTPPQSLPVPSVVNGQNVAVWTNTDDNNNQVKGGGEYGAAAGFQNTTLDVTVSGYAVTKITNVTVLVASATDSRAKTVTATLNGTVITLGGVIAPAANGETGSVIVPLQLQTDSGTYVKVDVSYNPSTGYAQFLSPTNPPVLTVTDSGDSLMVSSSNNLKYTLSASALKNTPDGLVTNVNPEIVTKVNSGVNNNSVHYLNELGKAMTTAAAGCFDYTGSPAINQAIGKAIASINSSSFAAWKTAAQRAAWATKKGNTTNPNNDQLLSTGYTQVCFVPYLDVQVSGYNVDGAFTAVMTPSYRIEIRQARPGGDYKDAFKDNGYTGLGYVAQKASLGTLTGTMGEVDIVLPVKDDFSAANGVTATTLAAHQDGTYAYVATLNSAGGAGKHTLSFTVTNAGTGSNGLGTIVINNTIPMVSLDNTDSTEYDKTHGTKLNDALVVQGSYDTLQAAVNDVANLGTITVGKDYKGSMSFSVPGLAKTFYVQVENNGKVEVTNSDSVKVVGPDNSNGRRYTIQLTKDNVVQKPTTNAISISVAAVTGGTGRVSASSAKAGDTITVTLTPSTGYRANGVSATAYYTTKNTDGTQTTTSAAVAVSGSGNTYTFKVPENADRVTVTPSFIKVNTNATVTVSNPAVGGTAVTSAGSSQVAPGTTVTVTATPATGYRTMGLYVTNATATRTGANTFSFIVPSGVTNVVVTPRFDRNNGTLFEDVWSTDYFSNAVGWAVGRGITNGDGSVYRFGTGKSCTREDMVTFLWRNAGSPVVTDVRNPFWDVQVGSYYYNAVMWAVKNGITNGVSATQFGVGQPVTRAQAVTFLYRSAGSPAAGTNSGFYDVPSSEYYAKAVSWAVGKGITNGDGSTVKFSPNGYCLREQIVTFMYRNATGTRA